LTEGHIVHLARIKSPSQLEAALSIFETQDRSFIASRIFEYVKSRKVPLPNVGALANITVPSEVVEATSGLSALKERLAESRGASPRVRLVTAAQLRAIKAAFVVRDPVQFRNGFVLWAALLLAGFWAVHLVWSRLRFQGDQLLLPSVLVVTGIGLMLMTSVRDPVRDTELFVSFAQGVVGGCAILLFASLIDYQKWFAKLTFLPLLLSLVLSVLLLVFGSGPGTSDAKVNLGPFQPVEVMRVCLVLFLAGYFGRRWQFLRELRETRPAFSAIANYVRLPKLDHLLPVLACVGLALLFFFLQKDLGPALLLTCLFLGLYALARGRFGMAIGGLSVLIAGFFIGYALGTPRTVVSRIDMFRSPWDNKVRGGDQLAGSLWAMASGGMFGSGPGLGEASTVPAAHTDLILAAAGEEIGWVGILAIFGCWGVLLYRGKKIAERAPTPYTFFLTAGCLLATALQILLISGGILGLLPLSGVVSPFLSYGRTAMLANFALVGIIAAASANPASYSDSRQSFGKPFSTLGWVIAGLFVIVLGRAAYVQGFAADDIAIAGTLVRQQDGVRRLQYNPRLLEVARDLGRGSILDRNGIPLATSRWDELIAHRDDYRRMGIDVEKCCIRSEGRHYPLGPITFHLLGDTRDHKNWQATNTAYVERDYEDYLRGFSERDEADTNDEAAGAATPAGYHNYRALLPLLRHRFQPDHPDVRRVRDVGRTVRLTVDASLSIRAAEILRRQLRAVGKKRGAVVVLDASTGEVLASVSEPSDAQEYNQSEVQDPEGPLFDRARFGLYPPGSVFKLVTAAAALRTDPASDSTVYSCKRLADGRVGAVVRGWTVRDDITDKKPHGSISLPVALAQSCNAYFAQLAVEKVGALQLFEAAKLLGIRVATPNTPERLQRMLAQAGYGQGEVLVSPFQIARLAATIANGGVEPEVRITAKERTPSPDLSRLLSPEAADALARAMRLVVTDGTGTRVLSSPVPIAGKTGTAEVVGAQSHAWFAGFASADAAGGRRIAFSVFVENGQYGGSVAAPVAAELVAAAWEIGFFR